MHTAAHTAGGHKWGTFAGAGARRAEEQGSEQRNCQGGDCAWGLLSPLSARLRSSCPLLSRFQMPASFLDLPLSSHQTWGGGGTKAGQRDQGALCGLGGQDGTRLNHLHPACYRANIPHRAARDGDNPHPPTVPTPRPPPPLLSRYSPGFIPTPTRHPAGQRPPPGDRNPTVPTLRPLPLGVGHTRPGPRRPCPHSRPILRAPPPDSAAGRTPPSSGGEMALQHTTLGPETVPAGGPRLRPCAFPASVAKGVPRAPFPTRTPRAVFRSRHPPPRPALRSGSARASHDRLSRYLCSAEVRHSATVRRSCVTAAPRPPPGVCARPPPR